MRSYSFWTNWLLILRKARMSRSVSLQSSKARVTLPACSLQLIAGRRYAVGHHPVIRLRANSSPSRRPRASKRAASETYDVLVGHLDHGEGRHPGAVHVQVRLHAVSHDLDGDQPPVLHGLADGCLELRDVDVVRKPPCLAPIGAELEVSDHGRFLGSGGRDRWAAGGLAAVLTPQLDAESGELDGRRHEDRVWEVGQVHGRDVPLMLVGIGPGRDRERLWDSQSSHVSGDALDLLHGEVGREGQRDENHAAPAPKGEGVRLHGRKGTVGLSRLSDVSPNVVLLSNDAGDLVLASP